MSLIDYDMIFSILRGLMQMEYLVFPIWLICQFIITIIKYLPLTQSSASSGSGATINLILYKKEVNYHL